MDGNYKNRTRRNYVEKGKLPKSEFPLLRNLRLDEGLLEVSYQLRTLPKDAREMKREWLRKIRMKKLS